MNELIFRPVFSTDKSGHIETEPTISKMSDKDFIEFVSIRFKPKHNEYDYLIDRLLSIIQKIIKRIKQRSKLSDQEIEDICIQNYAGFTWDKSDYIDIGYTEEERDGIRLLIKNISINIMNRITLGK